ncbi:MAG: tetratricopeptide repeat protein [Thermomicrobiales bacterium]
MTERVLPSGTVAFLFTDVEGSTKLWQAHGAATGAAIARHDALLRTAIETHSGHVFKTVGDAFCAAFETAPLALSAALAAQRALHAEPWGDVGSIRVRMAIHVGAAEERDADYFGPAVNRVARVLSAGHGGQVLLTLAGEELARDALPAGARLRDLGEHRLKDLAREERLFQVVEADLPADFPPLNTLDAHPHNLPVQLTPFLGRDREVASVRENLERNDVRLLTLTGPGGTGKTRLALQVAADLVEGYADGAWFVELEEATDADLVAAAIARALGVRETGGHSLWDSLIEFLKAKRLLLVLDNFEQVAHAAPIVGKLLAAAPAAKVLVTSRIRLGIQAEHDLHIPPLGLPPRNVRETSPEQLAQYEAVRLFVDRAQAAKADFQLTQTNAAAVAAICRELDGLPLAIELAAARVRMLPPQALLKRLEDKLGLLIGGARDRPERQQTMRAAIAWSHDLLTPLAQTFFGRLSVFAGGWYFEAAETIAGRGGEVDVLDELESLVDHSLVRQEETAEGEPRFAMLAAVREFARDQLEAAGGGEAELTHMLHAEYLLQVAETAETYLTGPEQASWLDRLESEHDNLRAALAWFQGEKETEQGLRLAAALRRFWYVRGYPSEGRQWLDAFLDGDSSTLSSLRGKALDTAGAMAMVQGDHETAARLTEAALACYDAANDRSGLARARAQLGLVAMERGDHALAERHHEAALSLYREAADSRGIGMVSGNLGLLASQRGDIERAIEFYEEALHWSSAASDEQSAAVVLLNLAEAREFQGDLVRASDLYHQARERFRQLGDQLGVAFALVGLGRLSLIHGDVDRAADLLAEGLAIYHELGDVVGVAAALETLAQAKAADGDPESAARWLGAAAAMRDTTGVPLAEPYLPDFNRLVVALEELLGAARWTDVATEGRSLAVEQLVQEVLAFAGAA